MTNRLVPTVVTGLTDVVSVVAGGTHTCALKSDHTVWCWGNDGFGELGDGKTASELHPVEVGTLTQPALTGVMSLVAGEAHNCAVLSGGTVSCWGSNSAGQLGDGTMINRSFATAVPGLTGVTALAAGASHTCALKSDGSVVCWGANDHGQLGNSSTAASLAPVAAAGLSGVVQLVASGTLAVAAQGIIGNPFFPIINGDHTCALRSNGTVLCWGDNRLGEIGDGTTTDETIPTAIAGLCDVTSIAAGYGDGCVLHADGTASCWGDNTYGEVGAASTVTALPTPTSVARLATAATITIGADFACALNADSTVDCWGHNTVGQLGDGTMTSTLFPGLVQLP